ncbi:methyltransferase domain-containing protein [Vreelandella titanicae]|uniref:methyltransferase domain-containing protein n=1 Tax=Vreelandella titanicae TaxID=664683 RepID=UPI00241CFA92|nr:methyltransferase domain-containing protein [Halomonas titanicae]
MNNNSDREKTNIDADSLMKLAKSYLDNEEYSKVEETYHDLLGLQDITINFVVAKSQALRNQHRLEEATELLRKAVEIGVYNSKILYVLAAFYRERKLWRKAEQCIWDVLKSDKEYSASITFASFAADILRKQGYVNSARSIITSAIYEAESCSKNVPLTAYAIQQELEYEATVEFSIEVSHRFYDAVYQSSEKYASNSDQSVYVPVWNKVLNIFNNNKFKSVVDIGCGPGQFAEYALNNMPELVYSGFDFSAVAISQAKRRASGAEFIVGNAFSSQLLIENAADVYVLLEVLEHIEQDLELLESMPGGASIVFSVPNFDSFGHVRFFLDKEEVFDRYAYLFCSLEIEAVNLKGYPIIYLVYGELK